MRKRNEDKKKCATKREETSDDVERIVLESAKHRRVIETFRRPMFLLSTRGRGAHRNLYPRPRFVP